MDYIIPQSGDEFSLSPAYQNALDQLGASINDLPDVISDAQTANRAASVLATIAGIKKLIDKAHAELKKPYLDASRKLDAIKKKESAALDELRNKINGRIVAYQRAEQEKARKAQEEADRRAREIQEAAKKERENLDPALQIAHAAATDIVARQEAVRTVAEAQAAPVAGMRITRSVTILSVSIEELMRSRIDLCKIEANLPAIKKEILAGHSVPGVKFQINETAAAKIAPVCPEDYDY